MKTFLRYLRRLIRSIFSKDGVISSRRLLGTVALLGCLYLQWYALVVLHQQLSLGGLAAVVGGVAWCFQSEKGGFFNANRFNQLGDNSISDPQGSTTRPISGSGSGKRPDTPEAP